MAVVTVMATERDVNISPDVEVSDTVVVIVDPTLTPDENYNDTIVAVSDLRESTVGVRIDDTHDFHWQQFAIPAGVFTASALFVGTPKLVQARHWVQSQMANKTGQPRTEVDNYLQYLPIAASYGIYFCGVKGEHNLLDRTILLAMSYATFAVVNNVMKMAFNEQRPNTEALNSFPSGHTGTAFVGAECLRREYWHTNKWIGVAGYACAIAVGYMRIYNNRHWINDVVAGAALGYMSTAFAYWLYPKIFRKRAAMHRDRLLTPLSPTVDPALPLTDGSAKSGVTYFALPYASTTSAGLSCMITF
ncbi:MAG: phosphatase PAP2 family protein [Muribaculaceae bacterium]|nr:phosphatase PAP2 family protein [Muribaculaceae bacterium]